MIIPFRSHDALLADIQAARHVSNQAHLWWLGQSGFLLQWQGRHLLFDPYLSDSLSRKYDQTDKPHVRMTERVIDPRNLGFVDIVTSSHNHTDHLDAETLLPILDGNPKVSVIVPAANREFVAQRLQVPSDRLTVMDDGGTVSIGGFTIRGIPSAHETVERDDQGRCIYLGFVVEFGGRSVYHSGDTVRYEGLAERLMAFHLDVAMLPINGRLPERRVAGNLWGHEAAQLAHDAGVRTVIPCHYEMFEFNTATTVEFVATAKKLGQGFHVLRAGERFSW